MVVVVGVLIDDGDGEAHGASTRYILALKDWDWSVFGARPRLFYFCTLYRGTSLSFLGVKYFLRAIYI